ncbi:MAG: MATE family efflux transporter [Alphaproteobacteria bacterium]|uniref:MATE family efflux transporter n=1 Tax=Aestuariivirga sp. TaxID=2650926 RepID=UPI0030198014|nr:MATE family efflux transporter [Alphaproteobacteria bacterium]
MSFDPQARVTHRSVLAVAVPIMLSNVSEPLIGVVNTAVIGQLKEPYYIGAIAVGALIFSFIFWGFGFLRMSTGGLSAQALGAGDRTELVAVLIRALMIGLAAGVGLILLSPFIRDAAFNLVGGSAEIRAHGETYFNYRIFAAPAALSNYCVMGWFIGQSRAKLAFVVQLFLNLTNMALSAFFVLHLGMTSDGVGLAALIAEWSAATLALVLAAVILRGMGAHISWPRILDPVRFKRTLLMNGDVMIRTLCLVFAFTFFTARGARAGDVIVAANAVLFNLFEVSAYLIDGFAYASEALVGQSVGARNRERFRAAVWLTSVWAMVLGVICSLVIWLFGPALVDLMTLSESVRETARAYLPWVTVSPVLGVICFQFDGIFSGAMATKDMRNMMIVSLGIFLLAWWLLEAPFGNHGLWAALNIFFVARGISFATRMPSLERRAFG